MIHLKVQDQSGIIHNIDASLIADYVEVSEDTTKLRLHAPYSDEVYEVPWNANELIDAIHNRDDTSPQSDILDCTPLPPYQGSAVDLTLSIEDGILNSVSNRRRTHRPDTRNMVDGPDNS